MVRGAARAVDWMADTHAPPAVPSGACVCVCVCLRPFFKGAEVHMHRACKVVVDWVAGTLASPSVRFVCVCINFFIIVRVHMHSVLNGMK